LLAVDDKGRTVWQLAAKHAQLDVLQKISEWDKENLTQEQMKTKFLLAADDT
jgi:hypothetical protein